MRPARHFQPGDKIIILGEAYVEPVELDELEPQIVIIDGDGSTDRLAAQNKKSIGSRTAK